MLAGALSYARGHTLESVLEDLKAQRSLLWVLQTDGAIRAAAVCYPDRKASAVHVWLLGGDDMDEWLDSLIAALERYARDEGLEAIQAGVRMGLARVLNRRGWDMEYTMVRKTL